MRPVFRGERRSAIADPQEVLDSTRNPHKSLEIVLAAAKDVRECGQSRAQIAFGLTGELGYPVSVAAVDAVLAESKANRIPAEWVAAWVKVTGSRRILELLCEQCGLSVATEEDRKFATYGRHKIAIEKMLWEKS